MDLPLTATLGAKSYDCGWIVYRKNKRKRDGEVTVEHEAIAYYPTFETCVKDVFNREIMASDAKTFAEALTHAKQVLADLSRALSPDFQLIDCRKPAKPLRGNPVANETREAVNG